MGKMVLLAQNGLKMEYLLRDNIKLIFFTPNINKSNKSFGTK